MYAHTLKMCIKGRITLVEKRLQRGGEKRGRVTESWVDGEVAEDVGIKN